uniref:Uncharacterized protein n=1 Tax=Laticauda laticaudata TaxID=8630 RepID=A0A8C5SR21_LATLA
MLHSPHKQPQNHKCGANFLQRGHSKKPLVFKWLISTGHQQPRRPSESVSFKDSLHQKKHRQEGRAMASNSLFSSVTPCQQNFFWGKSLSFQRL